MYNNADSVKQTFITTVMEHILWSTLDMFVSVKIPQWLRLDENILAEFLLPEVYYFTSTKINSHTLYLSNCHDVKIKNSILIKQDILEETHLS